MINCIIVEDQPLAQQVLIKYINNHSDLSLIKVCSNALEAFEVMHHAKIDLLFLDIQMPVLNGIDFIKSLKNPPAFIFTTAYMEYAAESYDLEAVDYLLKPITSERFNASINKFLKQHAPLLEDKTHTFFKVNGKFIKIEHNTFLYAQSVKDYLVIHTTSGNYITHMTMTYLTELLPKQSFRRVHRSYLINEACVTSIGKDRIEIDKIIIPIGKSYKSKVRD